MFFKRQTNLRARRKKGASSPMGGTEATVVVGRLVGCKLNALLCARKKGGLLHYTTHSFFSLLTIDSLLVTNRESVVFGCVLDMYKCSKIVDFILKIVSSNCNASPSRLSSKLYLNNTSKKKKPRHQSRCKYSLKLFFCDAQKMMHCCIGYILADM